MVFSEYLAEVFERFLSVVDDVLELDLWVEVVLGPVAGPFLYSPLAVFWDAGAGMGVIGLGITGKVSEAEAFLAALLDDYGQE